MGIFMCNWDEAEEQGNQNCSLEADYRDAQKVCKHLGIPLHTADFVSSYWTQVFTPFLAQVRKIAYPPLPRLHFSWWGLYPLLTPPMSSQELLQLVPQIQRL